jgi:PAS domain S-box-containing protein
VTDHVLDTRTDAVIRTDAHGCVREANRATLRLLGLDRDEVVGRPLADLLAAQRSEDARRRALLEAAEKLAQAGSWDWVPEEHRLAWSPNLYRIFGLTPGERPPTPEYVFSRTHADDRTRVEREVAALRSAGALRPLEYRIVRTDGGVRHLHATLAIAETCDGHPSRLLGWVQDVTERRRAERRLAAHDAIAHALDRTPWTTRRAPSGSRTATCSSPGRRGARRRPTPPGRRSAPTSDWRAASGWPVAPGSVASR